MCVKIDQLIRSRRRRSLQIEIRPDATLVVRAPHRMPQQVIDASIATKRSWIQNKQALVNKRKRQFQPPQYKDGHMFLFLGEKYPLYICNNQVQPLVFKNAFLLSSTQTSQPGPVLHKWYMAQAQGHFAKRVDFYADFYQKRYRKLRLSGAKKRWGSCSLAGNINLNWRLIMAPAFVIDYVVVHEVCHLLVKNHSSKFWRQGERAIPDFRTPRQWLHDHGEGLMMVGATR